MNELKRAARSPRSALREALLEAVGSSEDVVCFVPGEEAAGLDSALRWLEERSRIGEATDFRVDHGPAGTTVWLKSWPHGEIEPDWSEEWPDPVP